MLHPSEAFALCPVPARKLMPSPGISSSPASFYNLTSQETDFTWHLKIALYFNLSVFSSDNLKSLSQFKTPASLDHFASGGTDWASWGALLHCALTMKVRTPVPSHGFFCTFSSAHCAAGS